MPIPIMGPPSCPHAVMHANAVKQGATDWYLKALVCLWDAGIQYGVDPAVLAGQCAHETGWGRFGGAVTKDFGNTGGLKHRTASGDNPEDHARFALDANGYPVAGAKGHAQHARCYAGFPIWEVPVDERVVWIGPGTSAFGSAKYVEDLSGKWSPKLDYGQLVGSAIRVIRGF